MLLPGPWHWDAVFNKDACNPLDELVAADAASNRSSTLSSGKQYNLCGISFRSRRRVHIPSVSLAYLIWRCWASGPEDDGSARPLSWDVVAVIVAVMYSVRM